MTTVNNAGHVTGPHPNLIDTKLGSGEIFPTNSTPNTNAGHTVTPGEVLVLAHTHATAVVLLGFLTTATAANVIRVLHPGQTITMRVPEGITALFHQSSVASTSIKKSTASTVTAGL